MSDATVQPSYLGKPFNIVNGVISAESNEYGLQASFYATREPSETAINVTSTTGEICINGELSRTVNGDFATYGGLTIWVHHGNS